jgi:hypothetical protein
MKLFVKLRELRAANREERKREADEDLEALERGDIEDLKSHKRKVRDGRIDETFPSAGAGYPPPQ